MTPQRQAGPVILCGLSLAALSTAAVWFFFAHHYLLYYGDAEAHLNTARRIVDSLTPGYLQLGSPWLPLPHALMLPFVANDALWRSGLAGAIPSAVCFVTAGTFLFAAVRRALESASSAATAAALFALNPNVLYLQSIPMSESIFFACLAALLYFTVRFEETQGFGAVAGAGIAACAATLSRYDGWFLIPFAALYFLIAARRRVAAAFLFCAIAAIGPLYWIAHNWYLTGDPWWFYSGPYSAIAIQGNKPYAGKDNWPLALLYVRTAGQLVAGPGLAIVGCAGMAAAIWKRVLWPLGLLLLTPLFYVWSMHSAGLPIHLPALSPYSYYNTRYGLSVVPLLALGGAAIVAIAPARARAVFAALVIGAGSIHWLVHPDPEHWVTWKESQVNSDFRRAWTREAAEFLKPRYVPGSGILTSFGDVTAIYREMGIPLRETFTECDGIPWNAAVTRPELFLWQEWAVARRGDAVFDAVAVKDSAHYTLVKTIIEKDEPVIEIYHRGSGGAYGKQGSS
jgi:hypothetical protein